MSQTLTVKGKNGESLVLNDGVIAKWRHNGMQEVARNLASTYRQTDIAPMTKGVFSKKPTGELMVTIACGAIFGLVIDEATRPALDVLVAALEEQRDS